MEGHSVHKAIECHIVHCKADQVCRELDAGDLCEVWVSVSMKRPAPQYASTKCVGEEVLDADAVVDGKMASQTYCMR